MIQRDLPCIDTLRWYGTRPLEQQLRVPLNHMFILNRHSQVLHLHSCRACLIGILRDSGYRGEMESYAPAALWGDVVTTPPSLKAGCCWICAVISARFFDLLMLYAVYPNFVRELSCGGVFKATDAHSSSENELRALQRLGYWKIFFMSSANTSNVHTNSTNMTMSNDKPAQESTCVSTN